MAQSYDSFGVTGLAINAGRINDELTRELQGDKWRKQIRQMIDNDPTIGAILFAIKQLVRSAEWRIVAASDDDDAAEVAEFVRSAMFDDMADTWQETLSETLSVVPWGWAVLEKVFKIRGGPSDDPTRHSRYSDGRIGWRTWGIRAQETLDRWEFDETGTATAMIQVAPPDYRRRVIPLSKCLHFKADAQKGSPEGRSMLRNAWRPWYFKVNIENIEAIGIERDLAGLPVLHAPPEITAASANAQATAEYTALQDIITRLRRNEQEGVILPSQYDSNGNLLYRLELLTSGGTRQFDTNAIIARYDSRIAMSVLADFVLLGHEQSGSWALASSKTTLFATALGGLMDMIAQQINSAAIPELVVMNGWNQDLSPKLEHGDIEETDVEATMAALEKLTRAGAAIFPDPAIEAYLLDRLGLPVTDERATD